MKIEFRVNQNAQCRISQVFVNGRTTLQQGFNSLEGIKP